MSIRHVYLSGLIVLWLAGGLELAHSADAPGAVTASATGSMVLNGDFEKADPKDAGKPAGWDKPDGLGIQWLPAPRAANGTARGKAICINTAVSEKAMVEQWRKVGLKQWNIPQPGTNPVAETYGLSYYCDPMPVRPGQAYRLSFDFKGASNAKVWVRGWGLLNGEKRRRYETLVYCRTKDDQWTSFSQVFHPTKQRPEVTEIRVMLYAYYPPGQYWFDNVRLEPVADKP